MKIIDKNTCGYQYYSYLYIIRIKQACLKVMILKNLAKAKSKGKASFYLKADDVNGFTVTCTTKAGRTDTMNNVSQIEWLYEGKTVWFNSEHHQCLRTTDCATIYETVTIVKAEKIETEF